MCQTAGNVTSSALNPHGTGFLLINATSGSYNATGNLTSPQPLPFTPAGGLGTNTTNVTAPVYHPFSDYDYESLLLSLYQQQAEQKAFRQILQLFTVADFEQVGLSSIDFDLVQFLADQESGHTQLLQSILGPSGIVECDYAFPFTNVSGFVTFLDKLTSWGEATVNGFLEHLDSRPAAQLLLLSVTAEARQNVILRAFEGLFPTPALFQTAISQSLGWSLLSRYITGCSQLTPRLVWQNFPTLNITNAPNATSNWTLAGITGNFTTPNPSSIPLPGTENTTINFTADFPGNAVGPNRTYTTSSHALGQPRFAAWISQINVTYTELINFSNSSTGWTASASLPSVALFPTSRTPLISGSVYVVITDTDQPVTPFDISILNDHIIAGPAVFVSN
ncbi:hypothetical protein V1514DRAFT_286330 [Lipomyces japonicus]|uniref:uncharacterized protein n=1 Tax=Lipomyces japonicus TaxID=56871 RepID=UPI0034CE73DB